MPLDEINENKMQDFVGKLIGEMGAAFTAPLIVLGDKLGLYKALAEAGPVTATGLAEHIGLFPRYVQEWLAAQAAAGNVSCDPDAGTFWLSPEQTMGFADETSPVFMPGAYAIVAAMFLDGDRLSEVFRSGEGLGWHEHNPCLFRGTERFFRPGYAAHLTKEWIPALDGMAARLESGATVADVGCGHGASTIIMARDFPRSRFVGFDYHRPSIERARQAAQEAGVADRVQFDVATARDYPGREYDLVAFFDCLHDMGDPAAAARHVRGSLAPGGTWMIVEPFAHDELGANLNPVGRVFYAASTMLCVPASQAQDGACCLGAQAGERRLREVIEAGGFTRVRRAAETPFNIVLEARA